MDSLTITILGILLFILGVFAVLIFTENTNRKTSGDTPSAEDENDPMDMAGNHHDREMMLYRKLLGEYAGMMKKLKEKIEMFDINPDDSDENPQEDKENRKREEARITPEGGRGLIQKIHDEGSRPAKSPQRMPETSPESPAVTQQRDSYRDRIKRLEEEVERLNKNIKYYRDMVSRLQGNYTVINKYNYRICRRHPKSGDFEYKLVKLPHDFDPFNPTTITPEGIEIFGEYGLEIPTKLADIIRKEFSQERFEEYARYWSEEHDAPTANEKRQGWRIKKEGR